MSGLPALPAPMALPLDGQVVPRTAASSSKRAAAAAARTAVAEARLALAEAMLEEADIAEEEEQEQDLTGTTYAVRHLFPGETAGMNTIDGEAGQMEMGLDGQWMPLGALRASHGGAAQLALAADLEAARGRLEAQAGEQAERERVLREEHQIQQDALALAR